MLRRIDEALFDDESPHVDRFGWLLTTTIAAIVVLSLVDLAPADADLASDIGLVVDTVFVGATFLLSLRAAGVARRWRRAGDVAVALVLIAGALVVIGDISAEVDVERRDSPTPSLAWMLLSVATPVAVVRRILKHRRVGLATLLGAISAYLLIAVTFTYLFLAVAAAQTDPFFGEPQPTTRFMYFSLTTVTTLGYGDLSPTTDVGRLLATTEAVVGQIFLVTLVAALVGLFAQQARPTADG